MIKQRRTIVLYEKATRADLRQTESEEIAIN